MGCEEADILDLGPSSLYEAGVGERLAEDMPYRGYAECRRHCGCIGEPGKQGGTRDYLELYGRMHVVDVEDARNFWPRSDALRDKIRLPRAHQQASHVTCIG